MSDFIALVYCIIGSCSTKTVRFDLSDYKHLVKSHGQLCHIPNLALFLVIGHEGPYEAKKKQHVSVTQRVSYSFCSFVIENVGHFQL